MGCINPDGTLSTVARTVLTLLHAPHTAETAAAATGLPLYRVRATIRETGRANLIEPVGEAWRLTPLGEEALELDAA